MISRAVKKTDFPQFAQDATLESGNPQFYQQQRQVADYICHLILQLKDLAKVAKLSHVEVPLEFAYYEAFSIANRTLPSLAEIEQINKLEVAAGQMAEIPEELKIFAALQDINN